MRRLLIGMFFVIALYAPSPVRAAIQLMQHTSRDAGTTTSSTLAFASNNAAGSFIAVIIRGGRSGESFTVRDSRSNTYRQATLLNVSLYTPLGDTLAFYYAENVGAGPNTI